MRHLSNIALLISAAMFLGAAASWNLLPLWQDPVVSIDAHSLETEYSEVYLQSERRAAIQKGIETDSFSFSIPNRSATTQFVRFREISCDCVDVLMDQRIVKIGDSVQVPARSVLTVTLRPPISNRRGLSENSVALTVDGDSKPLTLTVSTRVIEDIALDAGCLKVSAEAGQATRLGLAIRQREKVRSLPAVVLKCTGLPPGISVQPELSQFRPLGNGLVEATGVLSFRAVDGDVRSSRSYPTIEVHSADGTTIERRLCLIVGDPDTNSSDLVKLNQPSSL